MASLVWPVVGSRVSNCLFTSHNRSQRTVSDVVPQGPCILGLRDSLSLDWNNLSLPSQNLQVCITIFIMWGWGCGNLAMLQALYQLSYLVHQSFSTGKQRKRIVSVILQSASSPYPLLWGSINICQNAKKAINNLRLLR